MNRDDVTVLVTVVTFNSARLLPGLLDSLPAAFGPVPWRLVVSDNDSHDDTLEVLRERMPDAVVVEMGRNAGYAAGINAAVAAGGPHDAVLVLNPDVRLDPGCVPTLLEALREPGVGIAVPLLRDANGERIDSLRREPTVLRTWADAVIGAQRAGRLGHLGETVTDAARYRVACDTAWAEGSVQLVDATCWAQVGAWDESFFLYSEETDFHLRVGDAGRVVRFVPSAGATHLEGDSGTSPRLWPLLTANRVRLARRRGGRSAACGVWAALVLREGSRACLGHPTARAAVRVLLSPRLMRRPAGPEWVA